MFNYKDPATVSNLTHNFFKDWPEDKSTFSTLKLGEKLYKIESMAFSYTNIKVLDLSNNIIFDKFFAIPYFFEKQQLLEFKVYL